MTIDQKTAQESSSKRTERNEKYLYETELPSELEHETIFELTHKQILAKLRFRSCVGELFYFYAMRVKVHSGFNRSHRKCCRKQKQSYYTNND